MVYGDWKKSYNHLPYLLNAIWDSNPGTQIDFNVISEKPSKVIVNHVFWAFGSCIQAFKYCCPVITIDGTHLYGKYKHKFLITVGMDGGTHFVPLAFALVYEVSTETWSWFLERVSICYL